MVSRRKAKRDRKGKVKPSLSRQDAGAMSAAPAPAADVVRPGPARPAFTYLGGDRPAQPVALVEAHALLLDIAVDRARLYGELLAAEYAKEGVEALRGEILAGSADGGTFKVGEYVTALVRLEALERDRAARLINDAVRLDMETRRGDLTRDQAHTLVLALRNFAAETGMTDSPDLRRTMQRAVIAARQVVADARRR